MLLLILLVVFGIIAFVLFCVVRSSGKFNREINDMEQEKFIKDCEKKR